MSEAGDDDLPDDPDDAALALELTEEEKLEKAHDDRNMSVEIVARGDGENYAMVGDVVRLRVSKTDLPAGRPAGGRYVPCVVSQLFSTTAYCCGWTGGPADEWLTA